MKLLFSITIAFKNILLNYYKALLYSSSLQIVSSILVSKHLLTELYFCYLL